MERHSSPGAACGKSYMSGMLLPEGKENSGTGAGCFAADKPALYYPGAYWLFIYGVKCYCCTAVPYYFTQGLHLPSTVSGSWLTVYFLSGFPLSLGLNRINRRFTTRALAVFGSATWLVSVGMLVLSSADMPLWVFFLSAVISSVGIAILGGMPNACALKTVPAERSGAASGAISTISNLGAAMISAVLIPLLSVIDSRGGVPDYAASFPKTSLIMLGILAVCFFLTFFFPASKTPAYRRQRNVTNYDR